MNEKSLAPIGSMTPVPQVGSAFIDLGLPDEKSWKLLEMQAKSLIESGLLPDEIKKPSQAIVIMLKGREVGLSALEALEHIHVIKGRPFLGYKAMLMLIMRKFPATQIEWIKSDEEACVISVHRPGQKKPKRTEFTIEMAEKWGLTEGTRGHNWRTQPHNMLVARCVSIMARTQFSDALGSLSVSLEESEDQPIVVTPNEPAPKPERPVSSLSDDDKAHREQVLQFFEKQGVSQKAIFKYLNIDSFDAMTRMDINNLRAEASKIIRGTSDVDSFLATTTENSASQTPGNGASSIEKLNKLFPTETNID